jgi:peptidoglycan/LPS O-acetylase OafA/YrhL
MARPSARIIEKTQLCIENGLQGVWMRINRKGDVASWLRQFLLGQSLAKWIDSGRDNILQLRLVAALLVILGHSFVVGRNVGLVTDPVHALFPRTYTHLVGVMMFFVISGFLITLSWQRRPDLWRFLRARALRLWPGLAVCVIVCAFLLGPLFSNLPLRTYFGKGDGFGNIYAHVAGNLSLLKMNPFLPGVFTTTPVAHYVNGSLWTIPVEAKLYLCVAGLGVVRLFRFPWVASLLICALLGWLILWPMYTGQIRLAGLAWFGLNLAGFFAAGSVACLLRRHIPVSTGLMLLVAFICLAGQRTSHAMPFTMLFVTYFVFWFAYVPRLPAIPGKLDVSYGVYLWGFPTQQALVLAGISGVWTLFLATTPVVLAIGAASWLLVEKPCLRLKEWRPRVSSRSAVDSTLQDSHTA